MAIGSHKSTARFWVSYGSGNVRIKLRAGQTVSCVEGGLTDEGYSYTGHTFTFDGKLVHASSVTNARDCDGRISRDSYACCPQRDLSAGYLDTDANIRFPRWRDAQTSQRDYTAEAAGY